jgi:spore maturation protein CgeB
LKKKYDILSIGTFNHKLTKADRLMFADEAHRSRFKYGRAGAGKGGRKYKADKFSQIINQSHITGTSNTPTQTLAKCFEIPASRSLMMCNYSKDMEKMGFVDGETFVEFLRDKLDIRKLIEHYMTNPKERKLIIDNAYELVHERHTIQQRAKDWFAIMEEVMKL